MKTLKRSWLSVCRQKQRTVILFLIVFVLGSVIMTSIIIYRNTKSIEVDIKSKLGASATITVNSDLIEEGSLNGEKISIDLDRLKEIANSPYVEKFEYNVYGIGQVKNLESVRLSSDNESEESLLFKGVNYPSLMDIENNKIKLEKGTLFDEKDIRSSTGKAIISKKLAEMNNLEVNDKLTLEVQIDQVATHSTSKKLEVPIEIIGIFNLEQGKLEEGVDTKKKNLLEEKLNTLYFSNAFVSDYNKEYTVLFNEINPNHYTNGDGTPMTDDQIEELISIGTPFYKLKNAEDIQAFVADTTRLLKDSYFKVLTTDDQYALISGNIAMMNKISSRILIGFFVACFLIINLVILLFMKERKEELAILRSLGEKKQKIVMQVVMEVLIISFLALHLSFAFGREIEKIISRTFVYSDSMLLDEKEENLEEEYLMNQLSNEIISREEVENLYSVHLSISSYILLLISMIVVIVLSLFGPLFYILSINPKKVLML